MRVRANQYCCRFRYCLEAGSEVGRLTNNCLFSWGFINQKLAHHDGSGCNADTRLQDGAVVCPEPLYSFHECERGPDSSLGIVLSRARIAKIGEDAIAHVAGYRALVTSDELTDASVIRRNYPPHVFWV